MLSYEKKLELRWADLDPNFHLRHSVYYDFGAYIRVCFLNENGLSDEAMRTNHFGPILFREECIFRRELKLGDHVTINLELLKARQDFSRWTIVHRLKRDNELAAVLTLDGAWIDTQLRKLTALPESFRPVFDSMPRSENFEWNVK
jgi:acyl-CoA thioester hydrolase